VDHDAGRGYRGRRWHGQGMTFTRDGMRALLSLLDAIDDDATVSWPEPWQLIALEDALVLHTFETATRTAGPTAQDVEPASDVRAARMLREEFGLTEPEVASAPPDFDRENST
jgi:hypothetical protein